MKKGDKVFLYLNKSYNAKVCVLYEPHRPNRRYPRGW